MGNGVGKPALAKGFPVTDIDIPSPEHVPHGHFVRSGIRGGDDSDEVIVRDTKNALGFVNREGQTFFADFGTVGAAEALLVELGDVVSRTFLAGTR